ncbi:MAG: hypothetical protein AB7O49_13785 [Sphingomonadales bacterium]
MLDSIDSGEAHWIGSCGWQWWLDEPALPDLRWARLDALGSRAVIRVGGTVMNFASPEEALRWLAEEEFIPLPDAIAAGSVPPDVEPGR